MNNIKKIFAAVCVSLLAPVVTAADYSKFSEVKTIGSDFTMEQHLAIAEKPLLSAGKFYFERPGFLRWEYTRPFAHGILLDGDNAYSWKQIGKKKDVKDVSAQPFAKIMARQIYIFVSMDTEEIAKIYNLEERGQGLDLLPKDNSASQTVERIKLFFNDDANAVTRVEMLDKSGEKTIISFSNTLLNQDLPAGVRQP